MPLESRHSSPDWSGHTLAVAVFVVSVPASSSLDEVKLFVEVPSTSPPDTSHLPPPWLKITAPASKGSVAAPPRCAWYPPPFGLSSVQKYVGDVTVYTFPDGQGLFALGFDEQKVPSIIPLSIQHCALPHPEVCTTHRSLSTKSLFVGSLMLKAEELSSAMAPVLTFDQAAIP